MFLQILHGLVNFLPQRIMGASTDLCKNHAASRIMGNPKPSMNNSASKDVVCGRQYKSPDNRKIMTGQWIK